MAIRSAADFLRRSTQDMRFRTFLIFLIILSGSAAPMLAQLPDVGQLEEKPPKSLQISSEHVLIGLLNEPPARNATETNNGLFSHFYESQEVQFQVAVRLLRPLLASKGFKDEIDWKLESNKGKSIYSQEGVLILNQYLEPYSTGQGHIQNEVFIERIGNYFDFTPQENWLLPEGEASPTRSTMLSLLAGFLLRTEKDGEVHAKDTQFTRKMLEFMLLEGSTFDSYRINVAIPQTVHLKLQASDSLSLALDYVSDQRRAIGQNQKVEQDGAEQPATAPESKSEGKEKPKPESEGRSK